MVGSAPSTTETSKLSDDAAQLLTDADAFLRLGLVGHAIKHLAEAVRRDPALRPLREPLAKLYVNQHRYPEAIAELWTLARTSDDPGQEVRYLRYILRLDCTQHEASQRLENLQTKQGITATAESADNLPPVRVFEEVRRKVREPLNTKRPPSDWTRTHDLPKPAAAAPAAESTPKPSSGGSTAAQAGGKLAEQVAQTTSSLRQELAKVDNLIAQQQFVEAKLRLQGLAQRHPYSLRVRDKLADLERTRAAQSGDLVAGKRSRNSGPLPHDQHSRHTGARSERAVAAVVLQSHPAEPGRFPKAGELPFAKTQEVEGKDICEERPRPRASGSFRRTSPPPPPPPGQNKKMLAPPTEAASLLKKATLLRSFGQLQQASGLCKTLLKDETCGARAALLLGQCQRDLGSIEEAIKTFLWGINRPVANEEDLSELFYEIGRSYEHLANVEEATLFYHLAVGSAGNFNDANERIVALDSRKPKP